ncbi:MAG TPA: glycosyltransferase family 39 protein, partial [Candidatus Solibacter sp.]|nr:glycosyltransferase family 39 protein [Candidatus Solibacter sp.]
YGAPPKWTWENYPPLWFHVIAIFGSIIQDFNLAGRLVCLAAYAAIGVLICLIIERFTKSRFVGIWGALAWWFWLAAFDVSHVPVNDPHVPAIALSLVALYCIVREPDSPRWLGASAVLFSLSLFTKHSLTAFPAATAIYLFFTSRRRFAIFAGAGVLACVALLLLTMAIDGPHIFQHMSPPRAYYPWGIADNTGAYLRLASVGVAVALIWALRNLSNVPARLLMWAFAIALPFAMVYGGGAGSNINHYYDPMISTILLMSLALPELAGLATQSPFPRLSLGVLLIVPFFLTAIAIIPSRIYSDQAAYDHRDRLESEFNFVADLVRQQPGPAICESTPICSAAGKPREYDPFHADQLLRVGEMRPEQLAEVIASRHFGAIELEWRSSEPMDARPRLHFAGPVMRALFATYQLKTRTDRHAVFVPR